MELKQVEMQSRKHRENDDMQERVPVIGAKGDQTAIRVTRYMVQSQKRVIRTGSSTR